MSDLIQKIAEQARDYADDVHNRFSNVEGWFVLYNQKFAALVEEAVRADEREACAELMFRLDLCGEERKAAAAIRASWNT